MTRSVVIRGKSMKLGQIFTIKTKDVGVITVERRISPASRALAVEYVVRVTKGKNKIVVGITNEKSGAIKLARKTRDRLRFARKVVIKTRELTVKAGRIGFRAGKKGAQLAFKGFMAFEKFTRPTGRRKKAKKKTTRRRK